MKSWVPFTWQEHDQRQTFVAFSEKKKKKRSVSNQIWTQVLKISSPLRYHSSHHKWSLVLTSRPPSVSIQAVLIWLQCSFDCNYHLSWVQWWVQPHNDLSGEFGSPEKIGTKFSGFFRNVPVGRTNISSDRSLSLSSFFGAAEVVEDQALDQWIWVRILP